MFQRIIFEDSAALFTIAAFLTAASIFTAFVWRALRMTPEQRARFENLPFSTSTPAAEARPSHPEAAISNRAQQTGSPSRHDTKA